MAGAASRAAAAAGLAAALRAGCVCWGGLLPQVTALHEVRATTTLLPTLHEVRATTTLLPTPHEVRATTTLLPTLPEVRARDTDVSNTTLQHPIVCQVFHFL